MDVRELVSLASLHAKPGPDFVYDFTCKFFQWISLYLKCCLRVGWLAGSTLRINKSSKVCMSAYLLQSCFVLHMSFPRAALAVPIMKIHIFTLPYLVIMQRSLLFTVSFSSLPA